MIKFLRGLDKSALAVFVFSFSFISLLYSKWLLTLSLLFLIPLSVLNIFQLSTGSVDWKDRIRIHLNFYKTYKPYWALGLIFIVVLVSGLVFGTSEYWIDRLRIKLPLLIAPFLFAFISPLPKKYYRAWMNFIIALAVLSQGLVLAEYISNLESVNEAISKGGSLSTPISHIRYSIFIAFAMSLAFWQFIAPSKKYSFTIKLVLLFIGLFLFATLHILSVRTGLIAGYIGFGSCLLYWIFKSKNWISGAILIVLISFGPILAYRTIPSFKSKVDYSLFDYRMMKQGQGEAYSDGDRIGSIRIGWKLFKSHPIFGIGVGNLRETMKAEFAKTYPNAKNIMPHNQFVSILASTGIIGFLISLIGFLAPLFYRKNYRHLPLICFYLIITASMMVENTLETSVGLSLFLLPVLIMNNFLIGQDPR